MSHVTIQCCGDCANKIEAAEARILAHLGLIEAKLNHVIERQIKMNEVVASVVAAETAEAAQIQAVLAVLQTVRQSVTDQDARIAALQAQIADLIKNGALSTEDTTALQSTLTDIAAQSAAMSAALATVPAPTPVPVTPPTT